MSNFGFRSQVNLDGSPHELPFDVYRELREKLDRNPPDKDWRALVRAVEDRYYIGPYKVEEWSSAINRNRSPADKLLSELACQGITVKELAEFLDQLSIETFQLGLREYEDIEIHEEPGDVKEVCAGDTLFLEVIATGHPYPRFQWFFCPDGENDFKRLQGRIENILRIESKKKKKEFKPVGDDDLDDYDEEEKKLKLNDEELALRLQAYEERGRSTRNRAAKKSPAPKKEKKERKKNDGNSPYSRPCLLSPELATIMGKDKMARNEVVKRMWEIVKERKLEDPKDRRYMLCDEELLKVFGKKRVQTFGMMKELKHHIKDEKDVTILSRDSLLDADVFDDEADDD